MFDELQEAWITELYSSNRAILIPSMTKQLSTVGLILDLDTLPSKPYPFKELFIRWLISVNKPRLMKNEPIIITQSIIIKCPIWKIVKCPLKRITLTKEGTFNKPTVAVTSFGPNGTIGSINSGK